LQHEVILSTRQTLYTHRLSGSSRHLVVGADSATAAILAAGLVGIASVGSDQYLALASVLALMAAGAPRREGG
jgi:MFS superfamily sulfate permease-like transporter